MLIFSINIDIDIDIDIIICTIANITTNAVAKSIDYVFSSTDHIIN